MKIHTPLGAGIAVAAVAATVIGVATPALASPATAPWHTQVGAVDAGTTGVAVSGDGSTAYVVVSGTTGTSVVPVALSSGEAGTPVGVDISSISAAPVAHGDTVAVVGYDSGYNPVVWSISNGTASGVALPGTDGAGAGNAFVQGVTSTDDGFLAVGAINGCLVTWSWAAEATTATEGTPACADAGSLTPFAVTSDATSGTVYAAVNDYHDGATTGQLWNLSDAASSPVDLPEDLGTPSGATVAADGTVYVAGSGPDGSNTQIASVHPGDPSADTIRGTGAYPSGSAQIGVVDGKLWLGSWAGIAVLDPADTTSYTPDSPAPTLTTDSGGPQYWATTSGADYLLVPEDMGFATDGSAAPGLREVVAPTAPAPSATTSGTTATVTWDASANGGTTITSATVTPTDTTTGTTLAPVTTGFFADAGYLDGDTASVEVDGLTRGHSYTFAVTQGNGFFTSPTGTSPAIGVPLLATPKPSKVAVVGTPQVGGHLTIATTGSWHGAALTYAWYSGSTKVGTAASYSPKASDAGARIKVAVTGTAAGRAPSTITSASVGPVTKPVYKVPHKPTITGTARVGQTLTAHITGLPAGAKVKFQWAYNAGQSGGPIGRASTTATLRIPASQRTHRIEVIAFVTVPGYATGSAMSALTAAVK